MMWVFGYGSLMWDDWETPYGCTERVVATLPGFVRAFNKASVENWGTKSHPAPTLNLRRDDAGSCTGMAFAFEDDATQAVQALLKKREGGFDFDDVRLTLQDGRIVDATAPIYRGKNLLSNLPTEALARMAMEAIGTSGNAGDYILNVAHHLETLGIEDAAVVTLAQAVHDLGHGSS